ncbi:hypothetical protein GQ457_10G008330 [Hibiscus cannabinus]
MPPKTRNKRPKTNRGQSSNSQPPQANSIFEQSCFRDVVHLERYTNTYKNKEIRPERCVDLDFLMSPIYNFDLFDLFFNWGWIDFLSISEYVHRNLVKAFYANAELIRSPNDNSVVRITSYLMGTKFEITPTIIAKHLRVDLHGEHREQDPHNIPPFRDDRPTHLDIEERLFLLITTWFFRASGGRATKMRVTDYWWLRCYRDRTCPDIATIIFKHTVDFIKNPSPFSLPYGCVLSHLFRRLGVDTTLDPPVKNKSKIDIKTCHKAQWFLEEAFGWIHRGEEEDDDDAPEDEGPIDNAPGGDGPAPIRHDLLALPPPVTLDFMYQTMITRFDNMDAFLRSSHAETTGLIRGLDARVSSVEEDVHAIRDHLFPPSHQHSPDA